MIVHISIYEQQCTQQSFSRILQFILHFTILQFYNFEFTSNLHRDKTVACNKSIRMRPITPEN